MDEPDRQFNVTVPTHQKSDDIILYNFKIQDHLNDQTYLIDFRFKDLQDYYKKLLKKQFDLPFFPKTHFWSSTNKDPQLIKQRRQKLEFFFNIVLNDPKLRGQPQIKHFIKTVKRQGQKLKKRHLSVGNTTQKSEQSTKKSKSLQKTRQFVGYSVKLVK